MKLALIWALLILLIVVLFDRPDKNDNHYTR